MQLMRCQRIVVLMIGVLLAMPALAAPPDCPSATRVAMDALRERMQALEPGARDYVPRPFPTTDAEVIEDLEYSYRQRFGPSGPGTALLDGLIETVASWLRPFGLGHRRRQPPGAEELVAALRRGTVRYEVLEVENWMDWRCTFAGAGLHEHLVRVFDGATGREVARSEVGQSGRWMMDNYPPPVGNEALAAAWAADVPPLQAVVREANTVFGLGASGAVFAAVEGMGPLHCAVTHPCVAFVAPGRVVIRGRSAWTKRGDPAPVYELLLNGPRLSGDDLRNNETRRNFLGSLDHETEVSVVYGQTGALVARRLHPLPPKPDPH